MWVVGVCWRDVQRSWSAEKLSKLHRSTEVVSKLVEVVSKLEGCRRSTRRQQGVCVLVFILCAAVFVHACRFLLCICSVDSSVCNCMLLPDRGIFQLLRSCMLSFVLQQIISPGRLDATAACCCAIVPGGPPWLVLYAAGSCTLCTMSHGAALLGWCCLMSVCVTSVMPRDLIIQLGA